MAVATGGAGAIGSAIVTSLAARGYRTVVLDRSGDLACDLASETSTKAVAAKVLDRCGGCDVLVHCAPSFDPLPLESFDLSRWRTVQAVNVEAPLLLAQAFRPGMVQRQFGRRV
ncbi:hypothetical protein B1R94_28935 [Mycolicibacterium litorale]|nr:hypothetical protein B1R94_28935 [Mycolicibacterium litorale]